MVKDYFLIYVKETCIYISANNNTNIIIQILIKNNDTNNETNNNTNSDTNNDTNNDTNIIMIQIIY